MSGKSYVVMWNQQNNMGLHLFPLSTTNLLIADATCEDDAIEAAIIELSHMITSYYFYMSCNSYLDENGKYVLDIINVEEDSFCGKIFDFKAMEVTD